MEEEIEGGDQTMVTFGSIVAISDFQDQNAYIFSDGFMNPSLVLKNFVMKKEKQKIYDGIENDSFLKCLFQVLPRVSDTAKHSALQIIDETEQSDNKEWDYKKRFKVKNAQEYLSALMNEYKQNIDAIEKAKNQKLTYHQPFQLLHVASGKFLGSFEVESTYENQNYLIRLTDYSNDANTVFTIVPAYTYQSHGEQDVNAGEMCAITRAMPIQNRYAYLSCSTQEISDIKRNISSRYDCIMKREVNASVEASHSWKIVLFQQNIPETSRTLRVGDCIWLYHSEADANLSVRKKKEAVDKENFSFNKLDEWLSILNLEVCVTQEKSATNALFSIEATEMTQGGYVKFNQGYLLKNLSSGHYLCVIEANKQLGLGLTNQRDKSTWFQFNDLKTQAHEKYVKGGSYTYVLNVLHKSWMDFQISKEINPILKALNQKTEHAVFKIQMAQRNEVWELNFLLCSFRLLAKFLIIIQEPKFPGVEDFNNKKGLIPKFQRVTNCCKELEEFVTNKAYTISYEQVYGNINPQRQKLMREQYYIDILINILSRIITKGELEFYQEQLKEKKPQRGGQVESEYEDQEEDEDLQGRNLRIQIINYINHKVALVNQIYSFIGSVCKFNSENQNYTYDLIPYFQLQTKYLPTAVLTIIDILASNKNLLYRLSDNLRVDVLEAQDVDQIKVLINLYDGDDQVEDEDLVVVKQHEKITSKPVNLMQYFINLIWDEEAFNNSSYLRFLRNVCSYHEQAISINQENLYKIYILQNNQLPKLGVETKAEPSKFNDGTVRLSSKAGLLIIPKDCNIFSDFKEDRDKFQYIIEQFLFFSEVALGRNYLWKKELGAQFEKSFLFRNIWNTNPTDPRYKDLQPSFAKLALTLYIDQEPLRLRKAPQMCQLFVDIDTVKDFNMFKSAVDGSVNIQELNTYNDLVFNLIQYYRTLRVRIADIVQGQEDVGDDLLSDELILNSTMILQRILKLQLLWVLEYSLQSFEEARIIKAEDFIKEIVGVLLYIFQYEKFEMAFVRAHTLSAEQFVKKAKEAKDPNLLRLQGLNIFSGGKAKQEEEEPEDAREDGQVMNEQNLYSNPVMKGYLKIQNSMAKFNYMKEEYIQNEVQLKIKICEIFEYLLDLRQDLYIQNALIFFKHYILQGDHIENDEERMRLKMHLENKKKRKNERKHHYDKLTRNDLNKMIIERLLQSHQLGLLPNLARTGIQHIDRPEPEQKNLKNLLSFMKEEDTSKKKFHNYIKELKLCGYPEVLDLDHYLSLNLEDPNPEDNPIGSLLSTLLNTFTNIRDKELEKRCLSLILRLFTQKEQFRHNILNLQVIFDSEKTILYRFIEKNMEVLQRQIERMDTWIWQFINENRRDEYEQCLELLESFNFGLKTQISVSENRLTAESETIDPQKQQLYANLDCHTKIINFVKCCLPYFNEVLLDPEVERMRVNELIKLLTLAFEILRNFCYSHTDNQNILFEHIHSFKYNQHQLGQLKLLKAMFKDNKILLVQKVDTRLVMSFIELIQKEGRQERFLKVLEAFLSYKNKYLFDNQLIILNALLPNEFQEQNIKTLYCDGSKSSQELRFYLDDPFRDPSLEYVEKLKEIDYRDTFRDEPFYYHKALIDLLIQTTLIDVEKRAFSVDEDRKDNFNICISKLKKVFSVNFLLEVLKMQDDLGIQWVTKQYQNSSGISILKLPVIEYLRLVHVTSERGQVQHSQLFYYEQQIVEVFEFEAKRLERIDKLEHCNKNILDYYFQGVLPFALSYYDRFLKSTMTQQSKLDSRKDFPIIARVVDLWFRVVLPHIMTKYQVRVMKKCMELYQHSSYEKLEKQIREGSPDDECLQHLMRMEGMLIEAASLTDNEVHIPSQQSIPLNTHPHASHHHITIPKRSIPKSKVFVSDQDDEKLLSGYERDASAEVQDFWDLFVKELVGNEVYQTQCEKERETIANAFLNITSLLDPKHTKQVTKKPDVKSISRQLIFYLQSAFNDPNCKDSIQTLLLVLQKIIENNEASRVEMQNLFDRLGATQMVLLVLSEDTRLNDKKLMMSFLQFINTMLQGGNLIIQKTIFNFMANYSQSENIFQKIHFIIKKQIENIEIISKSKKSINTDLGMLQIDEREVDEDLKLVLQVLTFLQNAVEGHYLDLQNYFRTQFNSRTNYDLTVAITDLFKTYYYEGYQQKNYDNMLKCLDTLNELVQGPCKENQIAVSESKFLDIASDLFTKYYELNEEAEEEVVKKAPEQELKRWMVARLMNKILNLIISLLEGREINTSNNVLKRIMRNLPINLLEKHSVNEYILYKQIHNKYVIEVLEHINLDPRTLKRKQRNRYLEKNKKYFESILQKGFLLFFLMSYYMECDPHLLSPIVQMHKKHKKRILKQRTSNDFVSVMLTSLKNSVFYMLGRFFLDLVQVVISYLNQMKNIATDQLILQVAPEKSSEELQKLKETQYRSDLQEAVKFYMNNSSHIDVMHQDSLEVVYFIKLPMTNYLPKEQKVQFHDNVDRSTTQSKVQGLVNASKTLIEVCRHEEYLNKLFDRYKSVALLTNHVVLWRELAFILTLFLNLFILFSFNDEAGDRVQDYKFFNSLSPSVTSAIIFLIGLIMTCLSCFVVAFFLLKNAPLIMKRAWLQKTPFDDFDKNVVLQFAELLFKLGLLVVSFLQEVEVMYYVAYGVFAILGTFMHPFFFIFHLSEILFRYPTLKNVILSVYKPINQLTLAFCLLFLLIYIFTIIAYVSEIEFGGYCDVLLYCFLMNIEWTFRGSIGNYMQELIDASNVGMDISAWRFFFDEASNMMLGVIMLNIVAGIIIDTFGSLREEEGDKMQDMVDNCFICGNLKADFDRLQSKSSAGFREHIKINHYMWNYMFFIAYLDWKEKTEYSGIESFVAQKLQEEDLCWVPFNQARELKGMENQEAGREKQLLAQIDEKMKHVQEQLLEMSKQLKIDQR